jgi:4-amino-4-deoxy-L-arabinose transferase-like glycosyltransferase
LTPAAVPLSFEFSKAYRWAAAALLVLHVVLAWQLRGLVPGLYHDEANYLLLGRAVADLTYRDLYVLGAPMHAHYPPGLPILVAVTTTLFAERQVVLIAMEILCSLGALLLLYDLIRRRAGEGIALTVLGLCAVNPELVEYPGRVLSETPYVLFATLALWAALRLEERDPRRATRWVALAVAASVYAALTRLVGVTIIAALLGHWLLERRFRAALVLGLTATILVGGWIVWTSVAPGQVLGRSYIADAAFSETGAGGPVSTVLRRVVRNVPAYATDALQWNLPQPQLAAVAKRFPGHPPAIDAATRIDDVVSVLLLAILGIAGAIVVWRQARPVTLYVSLYAGLLAVWSWYQSRFLMPIVPLLLWIAVAGAVELARRRRWLRPLPVVVVAGIGVMALGRNLTKFADAIRCDRSAVMTSPDCLLPQERAFLDAMRFVRDSTADTSIFLTATEHQMGYLTGRRTLLTVKVDSASLADLPGYLRARGIDYVVVTPMRPPWEHLLPELIAVCRELHLVDEFDPSTLIMRVTQRGVAASTPACDALRRHGASNRWTH